MRAVLDDHVSAAFVTDHISLFILYLYLFELVLSLMDLLHQVRIEVPDNGFPFYLSRFYSIEQTLHICGEGLVHYLRE